MNTRDIRFRSNRIADIRELFHRELDATYGQGEVEAMLLILAEAFLGWDRVGWMLHRGDSIDQSDMLRFHWALEDLHRHRPVQHIAGYTWFCGCRIGVDGRVLIPRPETEEMVSHLISAPAVWQRPDSRHPAIVDLCTGSGCIAIAMKRAFPEADVVACDISAAALDVARGNAAANSAEVGFVQADILADDFSIGVPQADLITANPPYVRRSERAAMLPNVLDHEPALALFVDDDDPLLFYRAIAAVAADTLADGGLLAVEVNEALANETCSLLATHGLTAEVHTDFRGKPRWLSASKRQ